MPRFVLTPKSPLPVWHSRQSSATAARVSNLALVDPCGRWQAMQPSSSPAWCSKMNGPRLVHVALDTGLLVAVRLVEHFGSLSHAESGRESAVRIVAVGADHEPFIHTVFGGQVELRRARPRGTRSRHRAGSWRAGSCSTPDGDWSGRRCRPRRARCARSA